VLMMNASWWRENVLCTERCNATASAATSILNWLCTIIFIVIAFPFLPLVLAHNLFAVAKLAFGATWC